MVGSSLLGGCTADSTEQETEICQIKKHATGNPTQLLSPTLLLWQILMSRSVDLDLHGSTLFWEAGSGSAIQWKAGPGSGSTLKSKLRSFRGSKWRRGGSVEQWSQIRITLMRSRKNILNRSRITGKRGIRIRSKVRIRNHAAWENFYISKLS